MAMLRAAVSYTQSAQTAVQSRDDDSILARSALIRLHRQHPARSDHQHPYFIRTGLDVLVLRRLSISTATIEAVTDRIEKRIQEMGETEIESRIVGEELMKELHQLDQVAYVRFASVYREFKDIDQFMDELRTLAQQRRER